MTTREPLWSPGKNAITLRDYFAAAAMQGYITAGLPSDVSHRDMAEKVYRAADAMLEARDR